MIKAIFILCSCFYLCVSAFAVDFSVMTFNTMCDFCHKDKKDVFSKRKPLVRKVLEDHRSDIIALQEVRTGAQVKELFKNMPEYLLFYTDSPVISYADPAIAINKNKFKVLDEGNFWLGPNSGGFTTGWKFALPRQALWVKVKSIEDAKVFLFISTHFDNRIENLLGSARMMREFIEKSEVPVLFGGDTNLVVEFEGYADLIGERLVNAFDIKENFKVEGKTETQRDLCYPRKGKKFPSCRVDHVLLSKDHGWKVKDWVIDARRLGSEERFPSDHRAIINNLSL